MMFLCVTLLPHCHPEPQRRVSLVAAPNQAGEIEVLSETTSGEERSFALVMMTMNCGKARR